MSATTTQTDTTTSPAEPQYVPEGFKFPENYPAGMFMDKPYSDNPAEQQHVQMRGPNGEIVFYNGNPKLNLWTAFGWVDAGSFQYVAPFQHENNGGGNTSLPFRLVKDENGVVVDILVVLWGRPRKTILNDSGQPDQNWLEVKGGFSNQNEARKDGADREHTEESHGITPGHHFETSVVRTAINRATSVLLSSDEGVAHFAYEMDDETYAAFLDSEDDYFVSIPDVTKSRDSLAQAAAFNLLVWVMRNYQTAL